MSWKEYQAATEGSEPRLEHIKKVYKRKRCVGLSERMRSHEFQRQIAILEKESDELNRVLALICKYKTWSNIDARLRGCQMEIRRLAFAYVVEVADTNH